MAIDIAEVGVNTLRRKPLEVAALTKYDLPVLVKKYGKPCGAFVPPKVAKRLVKLLKGRPSSGYDPVQISAYELKWTWAMTEGDLERAGLFVVLAGPWPHGQLIGAWVSSSAMPHLLASDPAWFHQFDWPEEYRDKKWPYESVSSDQARRLPTWACCKADVALNQVLYVIRNGREVVAAVLPFWVIDEVVAPNVNLTIHEVPATKLAPYLRDMYSHPEVQDVLVVTDHGKPVGAICGLGALGVIKGESFRSDELKAWARAQQWLIR